MYNESKKIHQIRLPGLDETSLEVIEADHVAPAHERAIRGLLSLFTTSSFPQADTAPIRGSESRRHSHS